MSEPTDDATPAAVPGAPDPSPAAPPPADTSGHGAYVAPGTAPASAPEEQPKSGDLLGGVLAGLIAAALGAALWALVAAVTHYEIGIIAVGVGYGVGWAVHRFGPGPSTNLALIAAGLAALGILAGFVLGSLVQGAHEIGGGFFDAVDVVSNQIGWGTFITQSVGGVGWLFLAIGAFGAFRLVAQLRRA